MVDGRHSKEYVENNAAAARGTIKLSDFNPKYMHPKAKTRLFIASIGTLLLLLGCVYMLSLTTITISPDLSTSYGISNMLKDVLALLYVLSTIVVIVILWYLMLKDCPISPAAKANYRASHDKSMKGVKLIAAIATAVTSKGSGSSIEAVANAADDMMNDGEDSSKQQAMQSIYGRQQKG